MNPPNIYAITTGDGKTHCFAAKDIIQAQNVHQQWVFVKSQAGQVPNTIDALQVVKIELIGPLITE
jgi:hypothetical protein